MGAELTKVGDYTVDKENRQKPLGKGAFGAVYKGKHAKKGFPVAIKQCIVHSDAHGSMAMKEIKNFQKIPHHKHIVRMFDYDYLQNSFWIVMEYCDRGDLEGYMKRYVPDLDRQLKIMYQCACAVAHLHSQEEPIVHRDIKPANVLFKKEDGKEVVKIADFGLTRAMEKGTHKGGLQTQAGTVAFMAPEIIAGTNYDESVDTFAMGLLFLSMINFRVTDEFMFPLAESSKEKEDLSCVGQDMLRAALGQEPKPIIVKVVAMDAAKMKGIKKLINDIVKYEPNERITMADVVDRLRKIADGSANPSSMVSGRPISATRARLSLSNMSLAQTRAGPLMSTMGGTSLRTTVARRPELETLKDVEEDSEDDDDEEEKTDEEEEDGVMEVDLGYLLMRRMMEDALRQKKEEQIKESAARKKAEEAAAMLPLLALMKLMQSDSDSGTKFEIGDRVLVDKDLVRAKELQTGHGGWSPGMEKYLDEEGLVKDIKGNIINVQFPNGQSLRFNALLLSKLSPSGKSGSGNKLVKGKFKRLDIVKFKATVSQVKRAQDGHGGWNDKMANCLTLRGVVHRVFGDGDVYVEFLNGDKWCVNPDSLQLVDTSAMEIEAGDIVLVIDEKEKVKQMQKGHGEWVEDMATCLGTSGVVRKVGSNNVAVVEINNSKWTWNIKTLRLIAKGEEMVMVMLQKQLMS